MCGVCLARMKNEKHKTKYAHDGDKVPRRNNFRKHKMRKSRKKTLKYSRFVTSTHRINTFEPSSSSSSSRSPKMYMYYVWHGSRPVLATPFTYASTFTCWFRLCCQGVCASVCASLRSLVYLSFSLTSRLWRSTPPTKKIASRAPHHNSVVSNWILFLLFFSSSSFLLFVIWNLYSGAFVQWHFPVCIIFQSFQIRRRKKKSNWKCNSLYSWLKKNIRQQKIEVDEIIEYSRVANVLEETSFAPYNQQVCIHFRWLPERYCCFFYFSYTEDKGERERERDRQQCDFACI